MSVTKKQLVDRQTKFNENRDKFAKEMDYRTQGQRCGLFSMPLSLTIGDASTNY